MEAPERLSGFEIEIPRLVARGYNNREIAGNGKELHCGVHFS
jgi:DNA-binding NarL/FixJ family response regulator